MEIVNAVLIFMALVLMWGALNLDRSPMARVEVDQSSQLNDSMTFLQKLRSKSPKEEIQTRRIRAFQANLAQITDENPELLLDTESMMADREEENGIQLNSLISNAEAMGVARLEEIKVQEEKNGQQRQDIVAIEKDLLELVSAISQVQQEGMASSQTIEELSTSIEKVRVVVGY